MPWARFRLVAYAYSLDLGITSRLDRLAKLGQDLLKAEWEKVKDEAESGRLEDAEFSPRT